MQAKFQAFWEGEVDQFLRAKREELAKAIRSEPDDNVLAADEQSYAQHLTDRFRIDLPALDFDGTVADHSERDIRIESRRETDLSLGFPQLSRGQSYTRRATIVTFYIPFGAPTTEEGLSLLRMKPNPRLEWTIEVWLSDGHLCFEVPTFDNNPPQLKQEKDATLHRLQEQFRSLSGQVADFNEELPRRAASLIRSRKEEVQKKTKMMESLGVPIRKRQGVPQTFAVPFPPKKAIISPKPAASAKGYEAQWFLEQTIYEDILQVIHDFGQQLTRTPSVYTALNENTLRDFLLLILEARYEKASGTSATGETFNKNGKTDILVRHQKANVFIAELGVWDGPKHLLDKITQLLGYLPWQDSKAAVIVFVRNKDFSPVLKSIEEHVPSHPNFSRIVDRKTETWFTFRFRNNDDHSREVQLAILAFHLPEPATP